MAPPAAPQRLSARVVALTAAAMIAFGANSILCRLALSQGSIDPASFTLVRLAAGVATLWVIVGARRRPGPILGSWRGALALFAYAAAFSWAYRTLSASTGALLLFGAVQATMVTTGLVRGEKLTALQWTGFLLALSGLAALLAPGASAPPLSGALLMLTAGAAWGAYSLLGRGAADPLAATAGNFLRALPMAAAAFGLAALTGTHHETAGIVYAVLSGVVASGLGYAIWYAALAALSPVQAASVQLSVPVLTALAGAYTLGEGLSTRLALTSAVILGGIGLVIVRRTRTP